jgi:hypothetical protein
VFPEHPRLAGSLGYLQYCHAMVKGASHRHVVLAKYAWTVDTEPATENGTKAIHLISGDLLVSVDRFTAE